MRLSDFVANFVADLGIRHVFGVVGGAAMYLNDSFGHHEKLKFIPMHHEQAAGFAADCYGRINGRGCCLVTAGPGSTNCLTAVAASWVDSIPIVYISGQVTSDTLLGNSGVRQMGVQETDIEALVKPITKYAITVRDPKGIKHILGMAVAMATTGRPGPVWLDIPLDVQSAEIDPDALIGFHGFVNGHPEWSATGLIESIDALRTAKRPLIIVGNGVRLAGAQKQMLALIDLLRVPVVTSWSAADMVADHEYHIGHCGLFGDRASNFTVQTADVILVLGCRLSIPMIGHNTKAFAPNAKIIMVDIDEAEIKKPTLKVWLGVKCNVKQYLEAVLREPLFHGSMEWMLRCKNLLATYPVCDKACIEQDHDVNSFYFIQKLSRHLPDGAIVVLDMATAFTCTYQTARMKRGQRWVTASGHAPMGYGLPGAIGAHYATGKPVVCIVGDGGLQMNLAELAVIAYKKLPITVFVLENNGYLTIKLMQDNHFSRRVGTDPDSGLSTPETVDVASCYGLRFAYVGNHGDLAGFLELWSEAQWVPSLIHVDMDPNQKLEPRVGTTKNADGTMSGGLLEDMIPHLSQWERERAMGTDK